MIRQFSAGGIVSKNEDGEIKYLLVRNRSIKDKKIEFWGFPKGHLENNEKSADAAIREVFEETAVKAKIVSKVGVSKYIFTQLGEKIFKSVTVFLMEYQEGTTTPQAAEILECKWVGFDEAIKLLSFKNDKNLLRLALKNKL